MLWSQGYSKLDNLQGLTSSGGETSTTNALPAQAGWSVDQQSGKVNVTFYGNVNLNGNSIINVSKLLGANGQWQIDETGKLIIKEIETEKICVGKYCLTEKEVETLLQQAGILNTQNTIEVISSTTTATQPSQ
ncbi:MAG: hypothetical protein HYW91_03630 [Candidatus Sungbacteria bacterium]|nr:hypothetical protein [Candidatus Sungbacteria bacterium]